MMQISRHHQHKHARHHQPPHPLTAMKNTREHPREIQAARSVVGKDETYWSIGAASGRGRFDCFLKSRPDDAGTLLCAIHIVGETWQRDRPLANAALALDFDVLLPQVVVNWLSFELLHKRLGEWQSNPNEFVCDLGGKELGDQRLTFAMGRNERLICSTLKPALTFSYSDGASMAGEWAFVVDQSCIRLCADELARILTPGRGA
jgi:hypothetical protein